MRKLTLVPLLLLALGGSVAFCQQNEQKEDEAKETSDGVPAISQSWTQSCIILKVAYKKTWEQEKPRRWGGSLTHTYVDVEVKEVFRGPVTVGETLSFEVTVFSGRDVEGGATNASPPDILKDVKEGDEFIVAYNQRWNLHRKEFNTNTPYTKLMKLSELPLAKAAAKLPIGWESDGKQVTSVWGAKGCKYVGDSSEVKCDKSGRPAFTADPRLRMTVKQTKKQNIVGEKSVIVHGIFEVALANPTDEEITVPALRVKEGKILWKESVLFISRGLVWLPVDFEGLTSDTRAAVLKPGESLTGSMPWSAQFSFDTIIAIGNLGIVVHGNGAMNYDVVTGANRHPKAPFQVPTKKEE